MLYAQLPEQIAESADQILSPINLDQNIDITLDSKLFRSGPFDRDAEKPASLDWKALAHLDHVGQLCCNLSNHGFNHFIRAGVSHDVFTAPQSVRGQKRGHETLRRQQSWSKLLQHILIKTGQILNPQVLRKAVLFGHECFNASSHRLDLDSAGHIGGESVR